MIKGTAKIDGIAVGEFTATFIGPSHECVAKAAFVNSKNGETHGWTTNKTRWSATTLAKLKELRESMEVDLAAIHLDGESELVVTSTPSFAREGGGLGEHLDGGTVPQV